MVISPTKPTRSQLIEEYTQRLESGQALLQDSPQNLVEVIGVLKSYGIVFY